MRIPGSKPQEVTEKVVAPRAPAKPATSGEAAASGSAVVVSASAMAASAGVERAEAARGARVAEVRERIGSGKYHVDRRQLAERMVDEELGRAGKR
jgi:flagellar biosynthesis anti-sigma factor FlgM